jgi:hypothetical protein
MGIETPGPNSRLTALSQTLLLVNSGAESASIETPTSSEHVEP